MHVVSLPLSTAEGDCFPAHVMFASTTSEDVHVELSLARALSMQCNTRLPLSECVTTFRYKVAARPQASSFASYDRVALYLHGHLGTPFDMMGLFEALSGLGFLVVAPEMADSVSANVSKGERLDMVAATRRRIDPDNRKKWLVVGHSKGARTACVLPGTYELGRVAVGGYLPENNADDVLVLLAKEDSAIAHDATVALFDGVAFASVAAFRKSTAQRRVLISLSGIGHLGFLDERVQGMYRKTFAPFHALGRMLGAREYDITDRRNAEDAVLTAILTFLERAVTRPFA